MKLPEKYDERTVLTKEEAAEALHVSTKTVERYIEEGRIPKIPNTTKQVVRIPKDEFVKRFSDKD